MQPGTKPKLTRIFDGLGGIKHPSVLMEPLRLFYLALICCVAPCANAQSTNPPPPGAQPPPGAPLTQQTRQTRVLSLTDAIQLALEHNLDIQIARLNPLTNSYAINSAYSVYEPTF